MTERITHISDPFRQFSVAQNRAMTLRAHLTPLDVTFASFLSPLMSRVRLETTPANGDNPATITRREETYRDYVEHGPAVDYLKMVLSLRPDGLKLVTIETIEKERPCEDNPREWISGEEVIFDAVHNPEEFTFGALEIYDALDGAYFAAHNILRQPLKR